MNSLFAIVIPAAIAFFLIDALLPRPSRKKAKRMPRNHDRTANETPPKREPKSRAPSPAGPPPPPPPPRQIRGFFEKASPEIRGIVGEDRAAFALADLDGAIYELFHDLYLPRPEGQGTAQIDHIVLSPYGIFVVETKNLSGWIFGREREPRWTQVLAGGTKTTFQNPLRQNYSHIEALRCFLNLPTDLFLSVVFLPGDCELKKTLPDNVITHGLARYIGSHRVLRLSQEQLDKARSQIAPLLSIDREAVRTEHIRSLKDRHGDRAFFMAA